ncbi:Uncharacterised protein [uncultured archaeon]|nr:Uncharacterised protein [uncultured archaeon]
MVSSLLVLEEEAEKTTKKKPGVGGAWSFGSLAGKTVKALQELEAAVVARHPEALLARREKQLREEQGITAGLKPSVRVGPFSSLQLADETANGILADERIRKTEAREAEERRKAEAKTTKNEFFASAERLVEGVLGKKKAGVPATGPAGARKPEIVALSSSETEGLRVRVASLRELLAVFARRHPGEYDRAVRELLALSRNSPSFIVSERLALLDKKLGAGKLAERVAMVLEKNRKRKKEKAALKCELSATFDERTGEYLVRAANVAKKCLQLAVEEKLAGKNPDDDE